MNVFSNKEFFLSIATMLLSKLDEERFAVQQNLLERLTTGI